MDRNNNQENYQEEDLNEIDQDQLEELRREQFSKFLILII